MVFHTPAAKGMQLVHADNEKPPTTRQAYWYLTGLVMWNLNMATEHYMPHTYRPVVQAVNATTVEYRVECVKTPGVCA